MKLFPPDYLNQEQKFYAFLKANHKLLYDLLISGEKIRFSLPRQNRSHQ
jgi:hypothetical protein